MTTALVRRTDSVLWELRRFWASGKRVALSLTEEAGRRAEGHVSHVSPTGGTVTISGLMIPTTEILAVHRPVVMGEDTNYVAGRWHFEPQGLAPAGQLRIPGVIE